MNEIEKKKIGSRINFIRTSRRETLEAFADSIKQKSNHKIRTTKSNVSKWEKGLNVPNDITLSIISELGGITVDELLYGNLEERIVSSIINNPHSANTDQKKIDTIHKKLSSLLEQRPSQSISDDEINSLVTAELILSAPAESWGEADTLTGRVYTQNELINHALAYYHKLDDEYNRFHMTLHQDTVKKIIAINDAAINEMEKLLPQKD